MACYKDSDAYEHAHHEEDGKFQYHAHIMAPDTGDKKLEETLSIAINFESKAQNTVHHVNVRIYSN